MIVDCSICNRPARIDEAVIEVDSDVAGEIERQKDAHEFNSRREHVESGDGMRVIALGREPQWPVIDWEWNHRICSDAVYPADGRVFYDKGGWRKGNGYSFDASRMSDSAEALGWTLHLQGKKVWMASTNWKEFIEALGFSSDS